MRIIIGLGNPGKEYEATRHNMGFLVLDELAKRLEFDFKKKKSWQAYIAEGTQEENRVILVKPQTFMNKSGDTLRAIVSDSNTTQANVIIVHDDADLPFGEIRVRASGSSGGHNGMQSILDVFGNNEVKRVRVGIGRPQDPKIPLDEWVLQKWNKDEKKQLKDIVTKAADAVLTLL